MGLGMTRTWPLLEYVIVALIGEAAFEVDVNRFDHDAVAALAEREFALLDEIDPGCEWRAAEMRSP